MPFSWASCGQDSAPRICGDDPMMVKVLANAFKCSPHLRG